MQVLLVGFFDYSPADAEWRVLLSYLELLHERKALPAGGEAWRNAGRSLGFKREEHMLLLEELRQVRQCSKCRMVHVICSLFCKS